MVVRAYNEENIKQYFELEGIGCDWGLGEMTGLNVAFRGMNYGVHMKIKKKDIS